MKVYKNIFYGILLCSLTIMMSCSDDDPAEGPSDMARFVGAWTATNVTLNNVDVLNPEYSNFRITFNDDGSYITVDGDPIFTDTGGFWSVSSSAESNANIALDGVSVAAAFGADNTTVSLSFTANDQVVGARTKGLVGAYVFALTKQ
ncbi:MAG: DUF4999 domain-containing protein [Cyclobacteriaceae bacterium]